MTERTSAPIRSKMRVGTCRIWLFVLIAGCGGDRPASEKSPAPAKAREEAGAIHSNPHTKVDVAKGRMIVTFTLKSSAFAGGSPIPRRHTGDGEDLSPPLAWEDLPAGTKSLALIVDDPDAPTPRPWVHWVLYGLKADESGLPEGVAPVERPAKPGGITQGKNSWEGIGYRGPAPPRGHGVHRYRFRLHALDRALDLAPGLEADRLAGAIKGHLLGVAELVGTYER